MRAEAIALGQALLDHHAAATKQHPPGTRVFPVRYTIRYGVLCERASMPHLVRVIGE